MKIKEVQKKQKKQNTENHTKIKGTHQKIAENQKQHKGNH